MFLELCMFNSRDANENRQVKCNVVDLTKLLTCFFSNCTLAKDLLCRYDACFWAVHHRACVVLRVFVCNYCVRCQWSALSGHPSYFYLLSGSFYTFLVVRIYSWSSGSVEFPGGWNRTVLLMIEVLLSEEDFDTWFCALWSFIFILYCWVWHFTQALIQSGKCSVCSAVESIVMPFYFIMLILRLFDEMVRTSVGLSVCLFFCS